MAILPMHTEGIVVEDVQSGFGLKAVVLDNMRPDEILIEMRYTGICHTDLFGAAAGYPTLDLPAALGHEGAGVVLAVGSEIRNAAIKVGDSVILSFNHCGNCKNCCSQHPACCSVFEALNINGKRLSDQSSPARLPDGRPLLSQFFGQSSFLRHSVVSQHCVVPCPYPEDLARYAALGCGFQTGAGTILNALKPAVDEPLVIFGAGGVGLAAIMAAKFLGLRQIVAVDLADEKLAMAEELGATHTLNSSRLSNISAAICDITQGGAKYAVDCTGATSVLENILDCVHSGGTAVIVGVPRPEFRLSIDPVRFLHDNKTLRGICQGDSVSSEFIPRMIQMHRAGHFPIEKLCTFYNVKDFEQAIADMRAAKIIKPVLKWN